LPSPADQLTRNPVIRAVDGLRSATGFLTIVPVPIPDRPDGGFADAPGWFPLVGAAVGAIAGGVRVGLQPAFGSAVATILALIAMVVVTGALHLDGLADTADGLGVRGDRERRLAVMRDSANGTFATLALVLWGLLLFAILNAQSADQALRTLIAAAAVGRWIAVLHGSVLRPARADGLGASFSPRADQLALATGFAVAAALLALGPARGAESLGVGAATGLAFTWFCARAFGGSTGDTLGAGVVLTEAATALAALALL
jgi:adenosylcobinamide-GDP ribazoletransferase